MPFLSRYRPFIVVASLYLLLMQLGFVVLALPGSLAGNADFRSFYAAGHLVRDGRRAQLYDSELAHSAEIQYVGYAGPILPFIHPSYEAALFALLSFFPYKTSFCLFFAINLALLALAFRLLSPPFAWLREAWPLLPAIAVAAFLPVGVCLIHGQDSILLLAILAGAYALDHRRREFAAGLLLGLGLFRFQLLLPLLLLLVFSRKWKFLYGFAASAVAVVAACVLVSGPEIFVAYPKALLAISGGLQTGAQKIAVSVWPETMQSSRPVLSGICRTHSPLRPPDRHASLFPRAARLGRVQAPANGARGNGRHPCQLPRRDARFRAFSFAHVEASAAPAP